MLFSTYWFFTSLHSYPQWIWILYISICTCFWSFPPSNFYWGSIIYIRLLLRAFKHIGFQYHIYDQYENVPPPMSQGFFPSYYLILCWSIDWFSGAANISHLLFSYSFLYIIRKRENLSFPLSLWLTSLGTIPMRYIHIAANCRLPFFWRIIFHHEFIPYFLYIHICS